MIGELRYEAYPDLGRLDPEQWVTLFAGLPDSLAMMQCIQRCGIEGFTFLTLIVWMGTRPILVLPLFGTEYRLSTLVDGALQTILRAAERWLGRWLRPRMLGVGLVEAEWGQVGCDPQADRATLGRAWDVALRGLRTLAAQRRIDVLAFVNFTAESGRNLPLHKLADFTAMPGPPYGCVPIVHDSTEAYLASLSHKMRGNLRRALRKARVVERRHTRDPGPWLDRIYAWYLETVRRSGQAFSVPPRAYFADVCRAVPGAEYVLYFLDDRCIAFSLVVVTPDALVDKYFGMEADIGRQYSLYFVSTYDNISYCIDHRIPLYDAGQWAEETKTRFGVTFRPSSILFKHRRPWCHWLLTRLARHVSYRSNVDVTPARLGGDWEPSCI